MGGIRRFVVCRRNNNNKWEERGTRSSRKDGKEDVGGEMEKMSNKSEHWHQRILSYCLSCFAILATPSPPFPSLPPVYVKPVFFPAEISSIRGERERERERRKDSRVVSRNRVKKCDGDERRNVAKRANRGGGGERKEGKREERRGEEKEREFSEWSFLCSLICQPMPFVFQPRTSRWK